MRKSKRYEEYVRELPEELIQIVRSVNHPIRQAILVLLNKETELSFSKIKERLGLDKITLNNHLKNLYGAGVIDHYFRHEFGNQEYSYYAMTTLGRRVLSNLIEALIPPVPIQKIAEKTTPKNYELFTTAAYISFPTYLTTNERKVVKSMPLIVSIKKASKESYSLSDQVVYTKAE
jgi:DNA-binding transcriptional ArsR family regulator